MASFGTPAALLFGLILLTGGLGLLLMGRFKPDLKRDSDNIYAAIGILCGLISIIEFQKIDVGMSLYMMLMTGSAFVLMWDNIRKRSAAGDMPTKRGMDSTRRGQAGREGRGYAASDNVVYQAEMEQRSRYGSFEEPERRPSQSIREGRRDGYRFPGTEENWGWERPATEYGNPYEDPNDLKRPGQLYPGERTPAEVPPAREFDFYPTGPREQPMLEESASVNHYSADRPVDRSVDRYSVGSHSGDRQARDRFSPPPPPSSATRRPSSRYARRKNPSGRSPLTESSPGDYVDYEPIDPRGDL